MSDFPWTTPSELVEQVRKHWDSGRLLGERFEDSPLFPLKLRTRNARSRDLSERFDRVREWVGMLREHDRQHKGFGYEIEWRRVNHRTRGGNDLPKRIVIPSREDALKMIGKTRAAATFDRLADDLLADFPQLDAWLARRPLVAWRGPTTGRGSRRCWRGFASTRGPAYTCANSIFPAWIPSSSRPVASSSANCSIRCCRLRPSIGKRSAFASSSSATD